MTVEKQIWLSYDVETTGPVPGMHDLLSLGIVAMRDSDMKSVGEFSANISDPADGLHWDEGTKEWWDHPERASAWRATRANPKPVSMVVRRLIKWLSQLRKDYQGAKLVWAAWPATFDFPFINHMCHEHASQSWKHLSRDDDMQRVAGFDMMSFGAALLLIPYHDMCKGNIPQEWRGYNSTPHVALSDAREQGFMLRQMVRQARIETGVARRYNDLITSFYTWRNRVDCDDQLDSFDLMFGFASGRGVCQDDALKLARFLANV